ncbi:MAG: YajQ family cyclic di-GMP-binding protein [Bacteroidota bacterium]
MAQAYSFDIVSQVDLQEVDNALNQARKEIGQRYDFKDSKTTIEFSVKEKLLTVVSDNDYRLTSTIDILQSKLIKRGVSIKALEYGKVEPASGGTVRQVITLRVGIDKENAKAVVKHIKDTKLKVQAQIMDDQVRVSGKDKDELQTAMKLLREADYPFPMQFVNYR